MMIDRDQNPPGPKGLDLVRSFLAIRKDRLAFIRDVHKRFGDVVGIRTGREKLFIVTHPDHARHVLVENAENYQKGLGLDDARPLLGAGLLTAEGETWRVHRAALRPIFDTGQLETFQGAMAAVIAGELDRWRAHAKSGEPIELESAFSQMVMTVLGKTLLGVDLDGKLERLTEDLSFLSRWAMLRVVAIANVPLVIPTPANLAVRRAIKRLESNVRVIRRAWLSAESVLGKVLSDENAFVTGAEVRDELLTFLLAGHETTVTTLIWALYLLATHKTIFERIQAEIANTIGNARPSLADLAGLQFLRMTLDEVLRLYPPVWMLTRKAKADDRLGQYRIPVDSQVLVSIYGIHRDGKYWIDPEHFQPERFAGARYENHSRHAYFPFGLGARSCLGNRFALTEIMTVLAMLAQRFNVHCTTYGGVRADAFLTLRPAKPISIRIEER